MKTRWHNCTPIGSTSGTPISDNSRGQCYGMLRTNDRCFYSSDRRLSSKLRPGRTCLTPSSPTSVSGPTFWGSTRFPMMRLHYPTEGSTGQSGMISLKIPAPIQSRPFTPVFTTELKTLIGTPSSDRPFHGSAITTYRAAYQTPNPNPIGTLPYRPLTVTPSPYPSTRPVREERTFYRRSPGMIGWRARPSNQVRRRGIRSFCVFRNTSWGGQMRTACGTRCWTTTISRRPSGSSATGYYPMIKKTVFTLLRSRVKRQVVAIA